MALFWFGKLGHICPNHLTGEAPKSVVSPAEVPQVRGRSMLVQRLKPILVKPWCAATWPAAAGRSTRHPNRSAACRCPGPDNAAKLPAPIYAPAAKGRAGDHDENITFERTVEMIGLDWRHAHPRHLHPPVPGGADIALARA